MLRMLGKVAVASIALVALCAASSHWLLADWATQAFLSKPCTSDEFRKAIFQVLTQKAEAIANA